jgi:hypothetical protein
LTLRFTWNVHEFNLQLRFNWDLNLIEVGATQSRGFWLPHPFDIFKKCSFKIYHEKNLDWVAPTSIKFKSTPSLWYLQKISCHIFTYCPVSFLIYCKYMSSSIDSWHICRFYQPVNQFLIWYILGGWREACNINYC